MRGYLTSTLLLTGLGLAAVAAFNYLVDPTWHWHQADVPTKQWTPETVLVVPSQRDERSFRLREIRTLTFTPDLLLLGSSRVLLTDSSMFPGMKVFNAGMSSATIEDFVHLWLALVAADRVPERILIFLDAAMLNANDLARGEWPVVDASFDRFAKQHGLPGESPRARILSGMSALPDLLNGDLAWRGAEKLLSHGSASVDAYWKLRPLDEFPSSDNYAYRYDGSLLYKTVDMLPKKDGDRVEIPPETHYVFRSYRNWSLSGRDAAMLKALLGDMSLRGARVTILVTPLSEPFYEKLRGLASYRRSVSDVESTLNTLRTDRLVDHVCDVQEVAEAQCERRDMMDFVHMLKPCVRRVLQVCRARGELDLPLSAPSESYY